MLLLLLMLAIVLVTWLIMKISVMPGDRWQGALPRLTAEQKQLREELRRDVEMLAVTIGHRGVHAPEGLHKAARFISESLETAGYAVRKLPYEVAGVTCNNIEVQRFGVRSPEEIIVVGAHYDSVVGTVGANDNGSGTAALLAIARRFTKREVGRTVRFVAFVNEEPPWFQTPEMGSVVYARHCLDAGDKIVGMISLETIGYFSEKPNSQNYPPPLGMLYPNRGDFIAFVGNMRSEYWVRDCVEAFRDGGRFPSEGLVSPDQIAEAGFSDHWAFWKCGYPGLMVTDTAMFRYPHYHEKSDTPDKINWDNYARLVDGLDAMLTKLLR